MPADRTPDGMPLNLSPDEAIEVRCSRCRKIVVIDRERRYLLVAVVEHYQDQHGLDGSVLMLEGRDFTIAKVPRWRCDMCVRPAEPPFWEWVTPPTPDYVAEDARWVICDACHPFVVSHDTIGLCRHVWLASKDEFVHGDPREHREAIRSVVVDFLNHVDPSLTRRLTLDDLRSD